MKKVKKRSSHKKQIVIGSILIFSGSLGLLLLATLTFQTINPNAKIGVLGALIARGDNHDTKSSDSLPGNGDTNGTYYPSPTPIPPTPLPTLPPPDNTQSQQIIDLVTGQIDNNISQTPAPTSEITSAPTPQDNATNSGPLPTQHVSQMGSKQPTNSTTSNSSGTYTLQQSQERITLIPPDSLSSTQQALNDILQNEGIHVTVQNVDNKTVITATTKEGKTVTFTSYLVGKLTDLLIQDTWPTITKIDDSNYVIKKSNVIAQTHFPLQFNAVDNVPTLTLGSDTKEITMLPDQATSHILQTGLIDTVGGSSFFRYLIPTYSPPPSVVTIKLLTINDTPAYAISGSVKKNLFSFIPIPIYRTIYISTDTGTTIQMDENPFFTVLDKLSQ